MLVRKQDDAARGCLAGGFEWRDRDTIPGELEHLHAVTGATFGVRGLRVAPWSLRAFNLLRGVVCKVSQIAVQFLSIHSAMPSLGTDVPSSHWVGRRDSRSAFCASSSDLKAWSPTKYQRHFCFVIMVFFPSGVLLVLMLL